jgi:glucosamine--fructose-6-phosphate aminotransferase (isomerizing)
LQTPTHRQSIHAHTQLPSLPKAIVFASHLIADSKDRVALVHNGVIQNASDLREELQKKGVVFRSETDTEVIVQLVSFLSFSLSVVF